MSSRTGSDQKAMTVEQQDAFRSQLVAESPKMDVALKSFCSWMAATYSNEYTLTDVLKYTRLLSKKINQHVFAIQANQSPQKDIVAQVWNQVVAANQKPTKFLGQTALQCIWEDLECTIDDFYRQEFERLLFTTTDPDAKLIWGNATDELARRATERQAQATRRIQQQEEQENQMPVIEELPPDAE